MIIDTSSKKTTPVKLLKLDDQNPPENTPLISGVSKIYSKEIKVQTRRGSDIANNQSPFISILEKSEFSKYMNRFGNNTVIKGNPSPIYNCHGLTFASRRTGIYDIEELWEIIKDDKYKEIKGEGILPGDIVLYITPEGDISHSGIVVSEPDDHLKVPRIWSKWGKYCEVIHSVNNSPYNQDAPIIKYYRLIEDVY